METRKLILSGAIGLILAAMLGNLVLAGEQGIGAGPVDAAPQVYLIKKVFDICNQFGGNISGSQPLPGGSVPPSGHQYGCVDYLGDRFGQYLFTGEQMGILVAVRHTNGAEAILDAVLTGGSVDVECNQITGYRLDGLIDGGDDWYGHDVSADLQVIPPAKSGGTEDGFDPTFDKLYECIYTATEADEGEKEIVVEATDKDGDVGVSVPDYVWFNPEISLDIWVEPDTVIEFAEGSSGETVYSTNTLRIKNEDLGGGVDVVLWLAGEDLTSSEGPAKCPHSNILDVEEYMEYRCKIGTMMNNPWNPVPNPNDKLPCNIESCQGATPLLPNLPLPSILGSGKTAECWFRLTYPTPCIGLFDQGQILIYARAL